MENCPNVREGLLKLRDEQLRRLAALASDKREAQRILDQIAVLEMAVERESATFAARFTRHKSAVLAILAFLDEIGHPAAQDQLIKALLDGGWRYGDENAQTKLKQSIAAFSRGNGRKTKKIKIHNGLIGRGDWDVSRFVR